MQLSVHLSTYNRIICTVGYNINKAKVKLSLWLIKHHCMKAYKGVEISLHAF